MMSLAYPSLRKIRHMFGLRAKILLGFGGMLLILLTVSLLGETVLDRFAAAMRRTFHEDFQSVAACQDMSRAIDGIDTALQQHFWRGAPLNIDELNERRDFFDQRLSLQRQAATLPGEKDATERLAALWTQYREYYPRLLEVSVSEDRRRAEYVDGALPKAMEVQSAAHELIAMNLQSMLSVHGTASGNAARARLAMHVLSFSGGALALLFSLLIGRFILQPVRTLTDSVREIGQGNLDLIVPVTARDELGVLAAAFNQMTAQLAAYRRIERDRLVRTEQTTQTAIDSLPDAVIVLNPAGRIELANQTARELFGLVPGIHAAASDKPWLADLYERIARTEHALALSGYDRTVEVEVNGETRAFLPRTVPLLDEKRRTVGATIVLADVTGLRRLDETKNGLLSMVSHELKTPLTSMRMVLHLVTEGKVGTLSEKQRELLAASRDDAERLHQIVENLLDMARIESGKALMELQAARPSELLARVRAAVQESFRSQDIDLRLELEEKLPAVWADPTRIGHVLGNLLSNALRHTPAGGHVTVSAHAAENWVEFSVEDDGLGIPRQYVHRVFEKFFRAPGQSGGSGSGLGLAIAKDIVEAHGGKIRASSNEGRGTLFAFTLRRADVPPVTNGILPQGSQELIDENGSDAPLRAAGDERLVATPAGAGG